MRSMCEKQRGGCTATEQIRGLERADVRTMPIIAMTANAFADDRQRTARSGMNVHLSNGCRVGWKPCPKPTVQDPR